MTPNRFLSESVTPAQWCVLSLGRETIRSARRSDTGSASSRQRALLQPIGHEFHLVVIQVDELEPRLVKDLAQPRLFEYDQAVAAVARPLGHEDVPGTPAPEDRGRRANDVRMRVDLRRGPARLDQVGLQEHCLAFGKAMVEPELEKPGYDRCFEVRLVIVRLGDEDAGPMSPLVPVRRPGRHPIPWRPQLRFRSTKSGAS